MEVDAIIGDAAYSGKENLKIASEQNIKIVARLNPSITQGFRKTKTSLITTKMPTDLFAQQDIWRYAKLESGTKM